MGRLFWKVFLFTLLAQLIATIGIGGAIWLRHVSNTPQQEQIDLSPPAAFMIESAAATLQFGGVPALHSLLANMDTRHELVAIGPDNHELLERPVNLELVQAARKLLKSDSHAETVRQVQSPDGQSFLLFSLSLHHPAHDFGSFGPMPIPIPMRAGPHGPSFGEEPPFSPDGHNAPHSPQDMDFFHFLPFLPLATALLGSLIFALFLAWYFSKPIQYLRSAFDAVAEGKLDTRLTAEMGKRKDELADLGHNFDSMVERLLVLVNGQKRLLHDVSHELRSPLARLQVAIGLARQLPEKLDISLERIERESIRMDKLVGELLTLSKLETGPVSPLRETINMDELIAGIVFDARFEAEACGRKFEFVGDCSVHVVGDAELLHRAIENVVRNALKQTAVDSTVHLQASVEGHTAELRLAILDQGPGVPDDELQAIFEPFFRGSGNAKNTEGHGLGLAIAHRVVASHRGRIQAYNRISGGLCVEIILPIAQITHNNIVII